MKPEVVTHHEHGLGDCPLTTFKAEPEGVTVNISGTQESYLWEEWEEIVRRMKRSREAFSVQVKE